LILGVDTTAYSYYIMYIVFRKDEKMTRKQIIKKIGNPHLSLHAGKGYFYFVFDKSDREFDERSVYTMRLNDLSLDRWVEEGKELLNEVGA